MHIKGLLLVLGLLFALQREGASARCFYVKAAVEDGEKLHFFLGASAITFDIATREQLAVSRVTDLFPGLKTTTIDAAYHPASDPDSIILTNGNIYYQFKNGTKVKGPSPLKEIFPRSTSFSRGIDAAVLFLGEEHFFKGCTLVVKRKTGRVSVYSLRRMGLPCYISSAWVNGNRLVMSRSVLSWRIYSNRKISRKPMCFANYFSTNFPMCKCAKSG